MSSRIPSAISNCTRGIAGRDSGSALSSAWSRDAVAVTVGVGLGTAVGVDVTVGVGTAVGVPVGVAVGAGVGVRVAVAVGTGVAVGVDVCGSSATSLADSRDEVAPTVSSLAIAWAGESTMARLEAGSDVGSGSLLIAAAMGGDVGAGAAAGAAAAAGAIVGAGAGAAGA